MDYINGEFIMKGCSYHDSFCLHSINDLIDLVKRTGFLPLFSNDIPCFSVEEHTVSYTWWTDNPKTDPWVWRQIAAAHPDIAYGKFFNKKAGFVSKEFFPVFANYRRNGYDFDSLFDDELASHRSKKIMDVFDGDCSLMTTELRELAGKDETTLTHLQMQTYLIISDFRQRKNKKGQEYGWHLSVYEKPETKWGQDFITAGYKEEPEDSWQRIVEKVRKEHPDADDKNIRKVLGIKWPYDGRR